MGEQLEGELKGGTRGRAGAKGGASGEGAKSTRSERVWEADVFGPKPSSRWPAVPKTLVNRSRGVGAQNTAMAMSVANRGGREDERVGNTELVSHRSIQEVVSWRHAVAQVLA